MLKAIRKCWLRWCGLGKWWPHFPAREMGLYTLLGIRRLSMNVTLRSLTLILLTIFLSSCSAFEELSSSEIAEKYSQSVVSIIALDENDHPLSLGSGFFLDSSGKIATNYHVLEGSDKAIIKTAKGEKGTIVEIVNEDPDLDLVIARTSLATSRPLTLGKSDNVIVGEDIVAIGNPAGLERTVSKGIISGVRKIENIKLIQITAPISPGSSGGPVFNLSGKVIGVATAYLDLGQNLNFAMPADYLKAMQQGRYKINSPSSRTIRRHKDIGTEKSLLEIFDIECNRLLNTDLLFSVSFAIENTSDHPISDIRLFFVYRNYKGRIVSYSDMMIEKPILPHLALQFSNSHSVRGFFQWIDEYPDRRKSEFILGGYHLAKGEVEIRVLDYQIHRSAREFPADIMLNE
jgi:hypothetical protein